MQSFLSRKICQFYSFYTCNFPCQGKLGIKIFACVNGAKILGLRSLRSNVFSFQEQSYFAP